jgi:SAM-dependent methyltransferase
LGATGATRLDAVLNLDSRIDAFYLPLMPVALPTPLPTKLNLGCGQFPRPGFLNVDRDAAALADVRLDLSNPETYRAFPAGHFEVIVMDHVLEHLDDVFGVMAALHRLLQPGGRLEIRVPHFSRGITHPEHKHGFDVTFPEYLRPGFRGGYIGVPFELVSMRLDYMIQWDLKKEAGVKPWQIAILKVLNRFVSWLANLQPYACSRFWCTWVGGFEQIEFVFRRPASEAGSIQD